MSKTKFTSEFLAAQITGSCNLAGMKISQEQEQRMCDIIDGKRDVKSLLQEMMEKHRVENTTGTLPDSAHN